MASPDRAPVPDHHEPVQFAYYLQKKTEASHTGDEPPGGDDVEARLSRIDEAIIAIRSSQDRMEQRFDRFQSDMTDVKTSQVRLEERMDQAVEQLDTSSKSITDVKAEALSLGFKASGLASDVSKLPDKDWVHMRGWALLGGIGVLLAVFKYALPG